MATTGVLGWQHVPTLNSFLKRMLLTRALKKREVCVCGQADIPPLKCLILFSLSSSLMRLFANCSFLLKSIFKSRQSTFLLLKIHYGKGSLYVCWRLSIKDVISIALQKDLHVDIYPSLLSPFDISPFLGLTCRHEI